jgi:hypothetical protein
VGDPPGSVITPPDGFPDGHDPNDHSSIDSMRHWLRHADYYDETSMPGLTYFSSLEELKAIAARSPTFFADASARIRSRYGERRELAIEGWMAMTSAIA